MSPLRPTRHFPAASYPGSSDRLPLIPPPSAALAAIPPPCFCVRPPPRAARKTFQPSVLARGEGAVDVLRADLNADPNPRQR